MAGFTVGSETYHLAEGSSVAIVFIWLMKVGDVVGPVRIARPSPLRVAMPCASVLKRPVKSPQVLKRPSRRVVSDRSGSYKFRMDACSKIVVDPRLAG